jgi:hypothetical protein
MEVWKKLQHQIRIAQKAYELEQNVNMDPPQHLSNQLKEGTINWICTSPAIFLLQELATLNPSSDRTFTNTQHK